MFKALYDAYQHVPWIAWAPAVLLLLAVLRRLPFFYAYMVAAIVWLLCDGFRAGTWRHLGVEDWDRFGQIAVPFIALGDARYFALIYRYGRHRELRPLRFGPPSMWLKVAALTALPSLVCALGGALAPKLFETQRVIFITYEIAMLILALGCLVVALPRWFQSPRSERDQALCSWLKLVTAVEIAHYALWVLSDALILSGVEWGYGLRFVPDSIYYMLFIGVVYLTAPPWLKRALIARPDDMDQA